MTSVSERLAQLADAAFDTFGEPANLAPEAELEPEEWLAIRDEIHSEPWNDPARFPELVTEAVKVLGEIGLQGDPQSRRMATQCLRRMAYRAKTGAPYDEPREPDWSCDSERRMPR